MFAMLWVTVGTPCLSRSSCTIARWCWAYNGVFGFSLPEAAFNNTWPRETALQNYAPALILWRRYLLLHATDVPKLPGSDETLGWKEIVDDGVKVVFVPGD